MNRQELFELATAMGFDVNARTTKKELKQLLEPEVEHTDIDTQDFKERWDNAGILVIGSSYDESEHERWSCIDPNYIGVGFVFRDQVLNLQPSNPFAENWGNEEVWSYLLNLANAKNKKVPASKKFDSIYFDVGVWHHMPSIMKLQFLNTADRILNPDALLYVPQSSLQAINDLEDSGKWERVPEMDMTAEINPCLAMLDDETFAAFSPIRS